MGPQRLVDTKLQEMKALETPLPPIVCALKPQWMSTDSVHLIDSCAALRHCSDHNRNQTLALTHSFHESLFMDSCCLARLEWLQKRYKRDETLKPQASTDQM